MLLSVDGTNFTRLPCILKFLLCTKLFNFYFGNGKKIITNIFEKDDDNIYNNYNLYYNKSKVFTVQEDFINKLNGIRGYSETTLTSVLDDNNLIDDDAINNRINTYSKLNNSEISDNQIDKKEKEKEKEKEIEKEKMEKEKEYSPCNFFIIFKLIYLYFDANTEVYQKIKKSAEDNMFLIENNNNQQKNKGRMSLNSQSYHTLKKSFTNINKIRALSKSDIHHISSYKIFHLKEVMGNIQEYGMKTLFLKYLSKNLTNDDINLKKKKKKYDISFFNNNEIELDNKYLLPPNESKNTIALDRDIAQITSDCIEEDEICYEFKIESLTNNIFLDLFPFYEIDIKDILNSLDIPNNMNLFDTFFRKKNDDKNFNSFYTYNSFLSFEIYDYKFLTYNEIKSFMNSYKKYFLDKITNFSYTFLPLIIGIYNISYLSYNKVIILYRNPLAFTPNTNFLFWLKLILNYEKEKMESSTNINEIIDINEIEVINNLKLNKEDYLNFFHILDDDLLFLNNIMNFKMDFNLNLFVLSNYNNPNSSYDENSISNIDNKNNMTDNTNLMSALRNTEYFPGNNGFDPYNVKKQFFGSESISFLETLYKSDDTHNNNYNFKIYFTEIFKKKNVDKNFKSKNKKHTISKNVHKDINNKINNKNSISNSPKINNEIKTYNQQLCKNLKNRLLNKIGKSENFLEE